MHLSMRRFLFALVLLHAPAALFAATRGVIFDDEGRPAAGARVTAHRVEPLAVKHRRMLEGSVRPELGATTTDANGEFVLGETGGGVLEIRVEREGFAPRRELILTGDEQVVLDLTTALPRTGRVMGKGKSLEGVLVAAYVDDSAVWTTRTDANGRYTIPDPHGWSSALVFVHPDFAPLPRKPDASLDVVLEPGEALTGTVVDAAGRAVSGATVMAGPWSTATSLEDGTFALGHVAAAQKTAFAFDARAFGTATRDGKPMTLRIEPRGTIIGTVRDAKERPLEGVPVYALPSSGKDEDSEHLLNSAVTDARGNYSIPHRDPVKYGVFAYAGTAFAFQVAEVQVRSAAAARADFVATKTEYLTGLVVDEKKRPVAGATLQYTVDGAPLIYGFIHGGGAPSGRSGPNGRFRLPRMNADVIRNMSLRLLALRAGYAAGISAAGEGDEPLTIVLPAGVELAGVVSDTAGQPVAGAGIALLQDPAAVVPLPLDSLMSAGQLRPFVATDAAGRFSVRVNGTTHDLSVWKEGFAGTRVGKIEVKAGAAPLQIVLEQGVEIRGRLTSKGASGSLAGTITARGIDMHFLGADVAEDGTFTLRGLRPGPYSLQYIGETGRSIEHQAKAPIADLTIELPALAQIRGRVTDASTGAVLRSYHVEFEMHSQDVADADAFTLEVSPAAGNLIVTAPGYVRAQKELSPEAGKPTEVALALTPGRAVDGVVTNENGSPVAGAWVRIGDHGDQYDQMERTGTDGEFHLPAIPREAATLEIRADGYVEREVAVAPGQSDVRLDVVLSAGRKVSGHVFTSDGAPVSGATVHASGEQMQIATTDDAGAFTIGGLAPGPYTLRASRDELQSEEVPLGDEIPADLALMMNPSKGAGRIHGTVKGFTAGAWMFGVVRTDKGAYAMIGGDGKYTIDRAEAGEVELRASAQSQSAAATSAPLRVTVIADGDLEANLIFRDDVIVRGTVTESAAPAAGRKVSFQSGEMQWSTTTNEHGSYELTGIEPGVLYDVEVEGPRPYNTRHLVGGSGTFDIHIEWSRVEGRVVDAGGTAVADAKVTITADGADGEGSSATDANGAFSLPVSRGAHVLTIAKEGFATHTRRVDANAGVLAITLTRTDGLRVRLTDARNGKALDGYVVAVDASGLQVARTSDAQKDGSMLVPVAAGAYRIAVSASGYASQSMHVNVPHAGDVRFALTPGGTLILQADRASSDLVKLVMPNGEEYVRCQCNGIAEIRLTGLTTTIENVAPGSYTMQLLDPRGLVKATQSLTIAEGQTTLVEMNVPD
jgi:hypothetical protein